MLDWEAIRIQYEIFHEDLAKLAVENDIDQDLLDYAVKENGWKRAPIQGLLNDVKDVTDIENLTDDVVTALNDRMSIINTLKAVSLNPRYVALETAILSKATQVVKSIIPESPTAGDQLQKVSAVLEKLREQTLPSMAGSSKNGDDNRVTVQILNNVDLIQQSP